MERGPHYYDYGRAGRLRLPGVGAACVLFDARRQMQDGLVPLWGICPMRR